MRNSFIIPLVVVGATLIAGTGCQTTSQGSKTYTRGQAQAAQKVDLGTVTTVADVIIERQESGLGAAAGGVAGGVAASTIGHGRGSTLAATAGALAGSAAGSVIEKKMGKKAALEIGVKLDDGRELVIVQEKDDTFIPGERVRVLTAPDGSMRVRH